MDINKLNDAWIAAGQKVSDLNAKLNTVVLDDNFAKDKFAELKAQRDNAVDQRDAIKDQLAEARAAEVVKMGKKGHKPLDDKQKSVKDQFVSDFKNMMHGHFDMITEGNTTTDTAGNGGLVVPQDIQTVIRQLLRQQANLQSLVTTESTKTNKGSRVIDPNDDLIAMKQVEEGTEIPELDDPKLHLVAYLIKDYAGIFTVTNDELNDAAEDILAWLSQKIAKYVGFTRSSAILGLLPKATKKATITKFDDIKDLQNNTINPGLLPGAVFVTNQSGFNILSKIKDAEGRYMIQPDVTQPDVNRIGGKQVIYYDDSIIPDVDGSHPLYFGNFKEAITLFDRQNMNLFSTNVGGNAFQTNTTKVRVTDRFDVVMMDADAVAVGSFKSVANQEATTPSGSGAAK